MSPDTGVSASAPPPRLLDRLAAQAAGRPDAPAVADAAGSRLTHGELWRRAGALARTLRAAGAGPDDRVALVMDPAVELVVAMVGALRAGVAYVPLSPADPVERLAALAKDAGAAALLVSAAHRERLAGQALRVIEVSQNPDLPDSATDDGPLPQPHPDALAYVIYTSGSTGRPKGVGVSHRNLAAYVDQVCRVLDPAPGDVFSMLQPATFDSCLTVLYPALASGGTLWVVPPEQAMDAEWVAGHLQAAAVDFVKITPSHLAALGAVVDPRRLMPGKALALGGEASRWEWFAELANLRPGCRVINHYGPTETTVGVCALPGPDGVRAAGGNTPLGPAMAHARLYVLDDRSRPAGPGEEGELCIGGETVTRGYLGRPGMTAAAFTPDPFSTRPGARLYRSGDRARARADGTFEFLGRADDQVKIRGYRVEPGEAAGALAAAPSVAEAAVVAGVGADGAPCLVGYLVPRAAERLDLDAVRAYAAEVLPGYLVPEHLVRIERLPLTRHGKLDRSALPAPRSAAREKTGGEAVLGTEAIVAAAFCEVLGLESVRPEDSFFALGGHSLLIAKLITRLRSALRIDVPIRAVFESPTVAGLAQRLGAAGGEDELPPVTRVPREGALPASYGQARLWLLNQFDPGSALYNTGLGVRALGRLDVSALRRAVAVLVERHEVLRTRLALHGDGLVQLIDPAPEAPFETADLSSVDERDREDRLRQVVTRFAERPFDLGADIPFRVLLVRLAAEEHMLALTMHHVATEGPSTQILSREFGTIYKALSNGLEVRLEPPAVQYADFAVWQREQLVHSTWAGQMEFWREKLRGLPQRLELRTDLPRPEVLSLAGDRVPFALPRTLADRLRAFAAAQDASLFTALLAGFLVVLADRTSQRDVAVGTPVAFRQRPELQSTVGYFGNTVVLRNDLDPALTFRQLLSQVKGTTLEAIANRDLPFEKLVEELRPRRRLGDTPFVNVGIVVEGEQMPALVLDDVTFRFERVETSIAKFDLVVRFEPDGAGLSGEIAFRTDLFTAQGVAPMADRFAQVFAAVLDRPDEPIGRLRASSAPRPGPTIEPGEDPAAEAGFVAPRTELERELLGRWVELIGDDSIGVTDDFFDVGGHSLLATRIALWIKQQYGVHLPFRWCFDTPTVAELATAVLADQLESAGLADALTAAGGARVQVSRD